MKENIIDITLKSKSDYKNKYNDKNLSSDLASYILEEAKNTEIKQNIIINIRPEFSINESDKDEIVDMIRRNFGLDVSEIINITRKEKVVNIIFMIIGFVSLIIYALLIKTIFLSELILIIGWVFIGEAICNILYHGLENKIKLIRRKQIIDAKINFIDKEK